MQKIYKIALVVFGLLLFPAIVQAAGLYFSPSNSSTKVDSSISLSVYVSSTDQAMNAVSGRVSYPADKLEVISLSKTGSIVGLWVQEPTFSGGTVSFEGIILSPGYTGSAGKIITINFKVKNSGDSTVRLSSGSILANDGKGTNILGTLGQAKISVAAVTATETTKPDINQSEVKPVEQTQPEPEANGKAPTPRISSGTHPDSNSWYNNKNINLAWAVPNGVTSVRLLVGKLANASPSVAYTPAIKQKTITDLEDGQWYFHAQFRNSNGWGEVAHFAFRIDSTPPTQPQVEQQIAGTGAFLITATDAMSGIDHYEITLDEQQTITWQDDGSHLYQPDASSVGDHELIVKAIDKAGNASVQTQKQFSGSVVAEPQAVVDLTISAPEKLSVGSALKIKGNGITNTQVLIWLQQDQTAPVSLAVYSDLDGSFNAKTAALIEGDYLVWATQGVITSNKLIVHVVPSVWTNLGAKLIDWLAVVIPIIAMIAFLAFVLWYGWRKLRILARRLKYDPNQVDSAYKIVAYDLLQDELQNHVNLLKKASKQRKLTKEEGAIMKFLEHSVSGPRQMVKRQVRHRVVSKTSVTKGKRIGNKRIR
jgi:hypothetical protein